MNKLFLFCSLICVLFLSSAIAQPPNPPQGWAFVRDLDSITISKFHASGDTIFMFGSDWHVDIHRGFRLVSYNGGASWDSVVFPQEMVEFYSSGFFPNEAKLWISQIVDEKRRFYTSTDGKNYEWFEIGKDTTAALG